MGLKEKCWKDQWERGELLGAGNQARTYRARRLSDPPGAFNFVLKELKRQDDNTARARMRIEVAALEVFNHPGIARLADSNATDFKEAVALYLVTEHIQGIDLENFHRLEKPTLDVAVRIVSRVLDAVKHCHALGVLHRDIKPCHVILRNKNPDDPVLIDFGLAYGEEIRPTGFETAIKMGVGNRFIVGPEQMGVGPEKQDRRTDIMQCVGLLFHLLTGEDPGIINASDDQKPHERTPIETAIPGLDAWRYRVLRRIFGVGFQWNPERRWQSIEELEGLLMELQNDKSVESSFLEKVREIKERRTSLPETTLWKRIDELHVALHKLANERIGILNQELGEFLGVVLLTSGASRPQLQSILTFRCTNKAAGESAEMHFKTRLSGSDFVTEVSFAPARNPANMNCSIHDAEYLATFERTLDKALVLLVDPPA